MAPTMLLKKAVKELKRENNQFKQRTGYSNTQLKKDSLEDLKKIIRQDYGVDLSDEDANCLGFSLLRLSQFVLKTPNKNSL
jgi:alanine-alpha-ketoisovalerate/valine-pyruvate aminotransferase